MLRPRSRTTPGVALALLPLVFVAPACSRSAAGEEVDEPTAGAARREVPRVRVGHVERRTMVDELETTSKVTSEHEVTVVPQGTGTVLDVLVEEGQRVDAGQVLCVLDDRDAALAVKDAEVALAEAGNASEQATLAVEEADASVDSAERAAEQAQRDYDRNLRLGEDGDIANPISKQALEASRLERDNAEAALRQAKIAHAKSVLADAAAKTAVSRATVALERARVALGHMRVKSPIRGVVATRGVRVGDTVGMSTAAFVVTDPDELRAVFRRPQEELPVFTRGDDAAAKLAFRATAEAYPDRTFLGEVLRTSPTIDPDSGQFRVTARLTPLDETEQARLVPGMLVRLRVVTARHEDARVVPKRALRREGERHHVLVVEDGAVRRVDVEIGFEQDDLSEVLPRDGASLELGDAVVVQGTRDLEDGDPVEVVGDEASAADGE